jgi:glycogen synthase
VHNLAYHGRFGHAVLRRIGLPESLYHLEHLEFYGDISYLKGGLVHADYLTTVSRRYAREIQTPERGHARASTWSARPSTSWSGPASRSSRWAPGRRTTRPP